MKDDSRLLEKPANGSKEDTDRGASEAVLPPHLQVLQNQLGLSTQHLQSIMHQQQQIFAMQQV